MAIEIPGGKRNLNMNINAQQVIQMHTYQTIQVYIKFNLLTFRRYIATLSELYIMNKHKLYPYIHDN